MSSIALFLEAAVVIGWGKVIGELGVQLPIPMTIRLFSFASFPDGMSCQQLNLGWKKTKLSRKNVYI